MLQYSILKFKHLTFWLILSTPSIPRCIPNSIYDIFNFEMSPLISESINYNNNIINQFVATRKRTRKILYYYYCNFFFKPKFL